MIVSFCAALIAVQCFVFPYDAANEFIRIFEAVEGIAVFDLHNSERQKENGQ